MLFYDQKTLKDKPPIEFVKNANQKKMRHFLIWACLDGKLTECVDLVLLQLLIIILPYIEFVLRGQRRNTKVADLSGVPEVHWICVQNVKT